MRFVEHNGVTDIVDGGRSETPILTMSNIVNKNVIKITVSFTAKTGPNTSNGFSYSVKPSKASSATALSSQDSTMQGNAGWQTTTKTVLFLATIAGDTATEEIDFEVNFNSGGLDGKGQFSDFLMTGEVVPLDEA